MKTRQIHGLGLGEFLIFAPAKEMLKSAYFFSALSSICRRFFSFFYSPITVATMLRLPPVSRNSQR